MSLAKIKYFTYFIGLSILFQSGSTIAQSAPIGCSNPCIYGTAQIASGSLRGWHTYLCLKNKQTMGPNGYFVGNAINGVACYCSSGDKPQVTNCVAGLTDWQWHLVQ